MMLTQTQTREAYEAWAKADAMLRLEDDGSTCTVDNATKEKARLYVDSWIASPLRLFLQQHGNPLLIAALDREHWIRQQHQRERYNERKRRGQS